MLSYPTENPVKLDRFRDDVLFKACEALTEVVPSYQQFKSWPADIVAQASASLKSKPAEAHA